MDFAEEITFLKGRAQISERRLDDLETDVRDIKKLTEAVAITANNVEALQKDMTEVKNDVKALAGKPGKLWDRVIAGAAVSIAAGLVAALLALVVK